MHAMQFSASQPKQTLEKIWCRRVTRKRSKYVSTTDGIVDY